MKPKWTFPEKRPHTRKTLDPLGCAVPNCGHDHSVLYLCSKCHLETGLDVKYTKATGVLTIECTKCGELVTEIQVAR